LRKKKENKNGFEGFATCIIPHETLEEKENALKEVVQEIALLGLSRTDFFSKAAFYGGTCLRLFYGLPRFSEDLDFALKQPEPRIFASFVLQRNRKDLRFFWLPRGGGKQGNHR
jgi:hypothetical protein